MKKTKYLVAALLLMGATTTFTSCIDNDEPAGIEELRGAKAELLKAKAVVEQAIAQEHLANAELIKAQAAHEQAMVEYQKLQNEAVKLQNDIQSARNEAEKAQLQANLETLKMQMEELALQHKTIMVNLQNNLTMAERNYELVLKHIEIAKATLTDADLVTIKTLESALSTAKNKLKSATDELAAKEEALYKAMLEKSYGNTTANQDAWVPSLKLEVEKAQTALDAATAKVTKLQEFLEKDAETADWRKEIADLEASIDSLERAKVQNDIEIEKIQATEEYIKAEQAYNGVRDQYGKLVQDGTQQKVEKAEAAYNKKVNETPLHTSERVVVLNDAMLQLFKGDAELRHLIRYNDAEKKYNSFITLQSTYKHVYFNEKDTVPANLLSDNSYWNDVVTNLEKYVVNDNTPGSAEIELAAAEKVLTKSTETYDKAVANWTIALNAVKGVAETVDQTALKTAVAAYNKDAAAVVKSITDYNTNYDNVYQTAYDKSMADSKAAQYDKEYVDFFKKLLADDKKSAELGLDNKKAKTAFDATAKQNAAAVDFTVKQNAIATTDKDGKEVSAEKNAASILTYIASEAQNQVNVFMADKHNVESIKKAAEVAGNQALYDNSAKFAEARKAIDTKVNKMNEAEGSLTVTMTAYDAFVNTARNVYAQELTAEAKKVNFYGTTGLQSGAYSVDKKTNHLKANINDITAEELTKATATELNPNLAANALQQTSYEAFGANNLYADRLVRTVIPTEEEVRTQAKALGYDIRMFGALGQKMHDADEVQRCKDLVAAKDQVAGVLKVAKAEYAAFAKEIKDNFEENLAAEKKAWDDAKTEDKAAKDAFQVEQDKVNAVEVVSAKLQIKKQALADVKAELISAVNNYLGLDGETFKDTAKFAEALKTAVVEAKEEVAKKEQKLAEAQANLKEAEEGKYDAVAKAQKAVESATKELAEAQAEYDKALANLNKGLEILAK